MIYVGESHIKDKLCDYLIDLYDKNPDKHERVNHAGQFSKLWLFDYPQIHAELEQATVRVIDDYKSNMEIGQFLPPLDALEMFCVKKYETGGNDYFEEHIDVVDYDTATRYLAIQFYLNDVEEGGETIFPYHNHRIKPLRGQALAFPPIWTHPHLAEPPVSNPKYILTTYMSYKDD